MGWASRLLAGFTRSIYGGRGRRKSAARTARPRWDWYLALSVLPYVIGSLAFGLIVVVVDPYDLRPWGLAPRIAGHRYPDTEWPLLIKAVTAQDYDTVLVGASTVMAVTPDQMRTAFGLKAKPVNLSYPLAAPDDTRETLEAVATMPSVKHVILTIDHSQMLPMAERYLPARMRKSVLGSTWAHAGDFSMATAAGSVHRVVDGVYDRPAWAAMTRPSFMHAESILTDRRQVARIDRAIDRYHSVVLGSPLSPDCQQYPFLQQVLDPALRRFVSRGVNVDVLFPPYPLAAYYDWIERRLSNDSFRRGPVFPQLLAFKTCVLESVSKYGGLVTVTAVDNDLSITGDLRNYDDLIHLLRPEAYQAVLNHVAAGDARLTLGTLDAYQQQLGRNITAVRRADVAVTPRRETPSGGPVLNP